MYLLRRYVPHFLQPRARSRNAFQLLGTISTSSSSRALSASTSIPGSPSAASLMDQTKPPKVVQYLGYGGTIPFLTGALATSLCPDPTFFARAAQLYGSSILSFLGAVHWGVALRSNTPTSFATKVDFVYGVTPSLVAWTASLMQPTEGLAVLTASFCGAFAYDYVRFRVPASAPPWYISLRVPLTIAAAGGSGVSYLAMRRKITRDAALQEAVVVSKISSTDAVEQTTSAERADAKESTIMADDDGVRAATSGYVASQNETDDINDGIESLAPFRGMGIMVICAISEDSCHVVHRDYYRLSGRSGCVVEGERFFVSSVERVLQTLIKNVTKKIFGDAMPNIDECCVKRPSHLILDSPPMRDRRKYEFMQHQGDQGLHRSRHGHVIRKLPMHLGATQIKNRASAKYGLIEHRLEKGHLALLRVLSQAMIVIRRRTKEVNVWLRPIYAQERSQRPRAH
ncbi:unnamed protein product [Agarophyton chilense]